MLDVASTRTVCTRYRVFVPVGAALVVWGAMSTAFSRNLHNSAECVYGEVATPGACAPEDVRATPGKTFLQVMEFHFIQLDTGICHLGYMMFNFTFSQRSRIHYRMR